MVANSCIFMGKFNGCKLILMGENSLAFLMAFINHYLLLYYSQWKRYKIFSLVVLGSYFSLLGSVGSLPFWFSMALCVSPK